MPQTLEPAQYVVIHTIDDMLRLAELIRHQRHRDPIRALEDLLLSMRYEITSQP